MSGKYYLIGIVLADSYLLAGVFVCGNTLGGPRTLDRCRSCVCWRDLAVAAKTFVMGGIASLVLTALGLNGITVVAVLLIAAFIPVVYSLVFYKQLEHRGELQG